MSIKLGEINTAIHLLDEGIAGARDLVSILQPVVQKSSIETLQNRIHTHTSPPLQGFAFRGK